MKFYATALLCVLVGCNAQHAKPTPRHAVSESAAAKVEKLYIQGVYAYAEGDTAGAITIWKKVLALDSGHKQTLKAMQEAKSKLEAVKKLKQ